MSDWLQEAGDKAQGGDAIPTANLVNLTFELRDVSLHDYVDRNGNKAYSYLCTVILDGEAEEKKAWLGGTRVNGQIEAITSRDALPIRVKLETLEKAYNLIIASPGPRAAAPAQPSGTARAELIAFLKENGMTASQAMMSVGIDPGADPAATFNESLTFLMKVEETDEDGAYRAFLNNVRAALARKADVVEPPSDDLPFE